LASGHAAAGRLSIRYNGVELAYRTFDKIRQVDQGAIADNKRLGPVLAMIRDEQLRRGPERRSGPRRRDQRDARLFKVGRGSSGPDSNTCFSRPLSDFRSTIAWVLTVI
jgi:hypothetical protein